jgi:hypothetical protein
MDGRGNGFSSHDQSSRNRANPMEVFMRRSLMAVVALVVGLVVAGSAEAQCVNGVCHLKQGGQVMARATESYAGPTYSESVPSGVLVTHSQQSGGGFVEGSAVSRSIFEATAGGGAPMAGTSNCSGQRCYSAPAPTPPVYSSSGGSCGSTRSYAPAYSSSAPSCNGGRVVRYNRCR